MSSDDGGLSYRPATQTELEAHEERFPSLGAAFGSLGFRRCGGVVEDLAPEALESLVADYEPEAEQLFRRWAHVPSPAFASPDGTSLAFVAWFWETPVVEIVSILDDGRPVLTRSAWQVDPPWPRRLQRYWKHTDRRTEQLYDDVPGRSVLVVESAEPADLWREHRAHVAGLGEPVPITLGDYCAMRDVMVRINLANTARANRASSLLALAAGILAFVLATGTSLLVDSQWLGVAVLAVTGTAFVLAAFRLQWVLRHWRRLRRPYPSAGSAFS